MPLRINEEGVKYWAPHPRQEDFLQIPDTVPEALYGGAAGGGKSDVLLMLPVARGWVYNPNFHGCIFRETFPQLKASLIKRAFEYYEPAGGHYNAADKVWTFYSPDGKRGGQIRFSYLEQDTDAEKHKTNEYNYVAWDELTAFSEVPYIYLLSRIRTSDPTLPAICRAATNPGGIGHAWVKKRFVDPAPTGYSIITDEITGNKRIFIPAKLSDNPSLTENDPTYINKLLEMSEADRMALIDGRWDVFAGQVFTEFRTFHIPSEPEFAIHICEPFEIPDWWPKILAIDWGFDAFTAAYWGAVAPDKRVYIYREYIAQKTAIQIWGADIQRLQQFDGNLKCIVLDPSAWRDMGEEKQLWQQIAEAIGRIPERADNDRIGGKLLLHEYLRFNQRPPKFVPKEGYQLEVAEKIFRLYGLEKMKEYEALFIPEPPETNLPKLQIFKDRCPKLIETIPACVYDEKKAEDVKQFHGDDSYDDIRYLLKRVDRYVREASNEFAQREELNKILEEFEKTKNQTRFYRQMEAHENKNFPKHPLSRFGRGRSYRSRPRKASYYH